MTEKIDLQKGGVDTNIGFRQKLKTEWDKYGLIASFLFIITAVNGYTVWVSSNAITRADKQAEANEKIGNLEGKMEILLQDRVSNSTSSAICR